VRLWGPTVALAHGPRSWTMHDWVNQAGRGDGAPASTWGRAASLFWGIACGSYSMRSPRLPRARTRQQVPADQNDAPSGSCLRRRGTVLFLVSSYRDRVHFCRLVDDSPAPFMALTT